MCPFACSCPFLHEGAGGVGYHQDSAYPWLHSMLLGPSIILILQWLLGRIHPMNRHITLIYCNHNLFTVYFFCFYVFPHALLPKIRWISYRAFLRMGSWMKAFGLFRMILLINVLVLKEVIIVAVVSCLLVVFFLLSTLLSFIAVLIVFLVHLVAAAFVGNCRLWFWRRLVCTVNVPGNNAETTCAICCWWQY